jgi:hypothetical protein
MPVGIVAQIQGHKPSATARSTTVVARWIYCGNGMPVWRHGFSIRPVSRNRRMTEPGRRCAG